MTRLSRKKQLFIFALVLCLSFGITALVQSTKAAVCYDGKTCFNYSRCRWSSGWACLNAGGLQTVGCQNPQGLWMVSDLGQCGTRTNWTSPWFCMTPTGLPCGGPQAVVCE